MTNGTNTGHYNTGHYNTGDYNTGHCNTGDYNTGNRNTGNRNIGHYNTGDYNTGHCNTGDYNTGHCNTGHYNTGNRHVGCFNTIDATKAYYFNKLIDISVWDEATKPDWLYEPTPTTWVSSDNMTKQEKADHPNYKTTGGYLRVNNMKKEWAKAYETASPEDIQAVRDLPGFDYDVFEEITGLNLREELKQKDPLEGREIEIDGKTYVLKAKGMSNPGDKDYEV